MVKRKRGSIGVTFASVIGTGVMVVLIMLCLVILSKAVLSGKAGEKFTELIIPFMMVISTLTGSQVALRISKERKMIVAAVSGAGLMILIVAAALTMDGPVLTAVSQMVSIGFGTLLSCLLCMKKGGNGRRRKRQYR